MGWPLQEKDIKRYPHFDRPLPLSELTRIASTPEEVAANKFWPFLHYEKSWTQFRDPEKARADLRKSRPICYAARRDSAIYSRYRALLSERYEIELAHRGLSDSVLAYRRIRRADGLGGKTNINFAHEAFGRVRALGTCCAVALDVKGYFKNMDHGLLKKQWCRLINADRLPPDQFKVFESVTEYAWVDRDALYERLGFLAIVPGRNGGQRKRSLVKRSDIPTQVCSPEKFREVVSGDKGVVESIVQVNKHSDKAGHGIPQGAPISDVLANLYLIDFDAEMLAFAKSVGGHYLRYSDDILILVPGGAVEGIAAKDFATSTIRNYGPEIQIKEAKTEIVAFTPNSAGYQAAMNVNKPRRTDGLEYLGFRFDGRKAHLRTGTLSGVLRKMTSVIRREAKQAVARHPGKDQGFLEEELVRQGIKQRFRRVRDFEVCLSKKRWTFYTYVRRAAKVFGSEGQTFYRQAKGQDQAIRRRITDEVSRALGKAADTD
jgi:hypothetical protein